MPSRPTPVAKSSVMTGRKISTGTAGCTRVKRSRSPDWNIGGEAFRYSERRMRKTLLLPERRGEWGGPQFSLVDAVAPDDPAAHRLHGAVHVRVGLEDPAHLAPRLGRGRGHVEVLDVHLRRHAGVLELRLDAEEADADAVDRGALAQEVPPAERQQPAVHL